MKFPKKEQILIFLAAFLLFAFLIFTRFYRLGTAPASMIIDEAHHGYIAHSLAATGNDEHGLRYPLVFKGFGDYKLPAYPYLLMPLVKTFGLSNFVVRLPAALAGILLIVGIYLLFLEWGFEKKLAFFAALIALCSPWSFILSRFAYESNLALSFFVWGLYLFAKGIKNNQKKLLFSSAICLALTNYAYISYKLIAAIFVLALTVYYFFKDQKYRHLIFSFFLPFVLLISPFFIGSVANSNLARFKQVGFLSDEQLVLEVNEKRHFCLADYPQKFCYLTWNKYILIARNLFKKMMEVFSPAYLFLDGKVGLYYLGVAQTGQLLLIFLPFYFLGWLYFIKEIFKKKSSKKELLYLAILAFAIAPLPAVLSGIQKIRLSALLPFIILLIVWGYQFLVDQFKKIPKIFDLMILLVTIISFFVYFVNFSSIHVLRRDYYYDSFAKDIFLELGKIEANYDEIVVANFFSDPIMYYAYYRKIDPNFYQKNVVLAALEESGFQHAAALGKYRVARDDEEITELACKAAATNKNILYVTNDSSYVAEKKETDFLIKIIKSADGSLDYAFIFDTLQYGRELELLGRCTYGF